MFVSIEKVIKYIRKMESIKRYRWLLLSALVVLAGLFFFYRLYHRDVKALTDFLAASEKFDKAVSDFSTRLLAQNLEVPPPADDPERKAEEALAKLEAKASIRLSSLIKNDAELMKLTLEIARLSGKELAALRGYKGAVLDKNADLAGLAKELADLTRQRQTTYARFRELAGLRPVEV